MVSAICPAIPSVTADDFRRNSQGAYSYPFGEKDSRQPESWRDMRPSIEQCDERIEWGEGLPADSPRGASVGQTSNSAIRPYT